MEEIIKERIAAVKDKIAKRENVAGYTANVEALKVTLGELERLLSSAEEMKNV